MKVQLLVSEWCVPCRSAEQIWRDVAGERTIAFEVLDVGQPEGRAVVSALGVRTVPSTVIDGELRHVGVPTRGEALEFVATAPPRAAASPQYVGLTFEPTSAWAISAAAVYLAIAGAALVFGGGIAGDATWRAAALHVFGLGFAGFLVFGFGEHLLPRFTARPIRMGALAWWQQGLLHVGVVALVAGFLFDIKVLAVAGGAAAWVALAIFTGRLWPMLQSRSQ